MLTKEMVTETVKKLFKAGKSYPQRERLFSAPDNQRVEVAVKIMQETVELIADVFLPQKISVETWKAAEQEALIDSEKIITPALIQNAIKRVRERNLQEQLSKAESDKKVVVENCLRDEISRILWRWTWMKLAERRSIMQYMPTEQDIIDFALRSKVNPKDRENYMLIKIYLNDCKYNQEQNITMKYKAVVSENKIRFVGC